MRYMILTPLFMALLMLSGGVLLAQETDDAPPLELSETYAGGDLSVAYPEGWEALEDSNSVILTNIDVDALGPEDDLPDDTLIVQLSVILNVQVPAIEPGSRAVEILEQMRPERDQNTTVTELSRDEQTRIAFLDISDEQADGLIYVKPLNSDVFALVAATGAPGTVTKAQDTVLAMVDSVMLSVVAPLRDEPRAAYDNITTSQDEDGYPTLGEADAPVDVLVVSSFDCPACAQFHTVIFPGLLERVEAGEIRLTYMPLYGTGGVYNGENATRAALCAAEQDAFWLMHDAFFDWQNAGFGLRALIDERIRLGADNLALDLEAWEACLVSRRPDEVINRAFAQAVAVPDFTGTPTVVIAGDNIPLSTQAIFGRLDELRDGLSSDD